VPSGNSVREAPKRRPVRAGPSPVALALAVLLAASAAGCARESRDVHAARLAADRYLGALSRSDLASLRQSSTCVVPSESIVGGSILRIDPIRPTTLRALDSLETTAVDRYRAADSVWSRSGEAAADSLFLLSRLLARRTLLYRNAQRAVTVSGEGVAVRPESPIRTVRMRVRLRFSGPLVGAEPIDREHILRALAVPRGRWIVFSLNPPEVEPRPEPI
jgi:gamma-glutamylcyclotransferase (GGCT)/AIG2-like uncharacterized protein YtfP